MSLCQNALRHEGARRGLHGAVIGRRRKRQVEDLIPKMQHSFFAFKQLLSRRLEAGGLNCDRAGAQMDSKVSLPSNLLCRNLVNENLPVGRQRDHFMNDCRRWGALPTVDQSRPQVRREGPQRGSGGEYASL
jgi:hypothetical protein